MATKKQVALAATEWIAAANLVDALQAEKGGIQAQLADVNARINSAQADEDAKRIAFKTLVSQLN